MFVKIVICSDPQREYLLQAQAIEFCKKACDCEDWVEGVMFLGPQPAVGDEILELWLFRSDKGTRGAHDCIVASHCNMFVMNDRGHTIDRLGCR